MGKYIKLFQTHSAYNTYISGDNVLLPNVSHCEDIKDIHYNPEYLYTTKLLFDIFHNIRSYIYNDPDLNLKLYQLFLDTNIRIRNINNLSTASITIYDPEDNELIDIDINTEILFSLRFIYNENYYDIDAHVLTSEISEYDNNNYMLIGSCYLYQTSEGYILDEEELNYISNHMYIIFPKEEICNIQNYSIIFNESNLPLTINEEEFYFDNVSLTNSNILTSRECVSILLLSGKYNRINNNVDYAVTQLRTCPLELINGDYSALEYIDNYKIPLSYQQHEFLTNYQEYL